MCRKFYKFGLVALLWSMLFGVWGCPSSAPIKPTPAPTAQRAPAGALRWDEQARQLPARTPAVLTMRGSDLLHGIDALYDWVLEDADMFGADGEQIVQGLANVHDSFRSDWSFDPLTTRGWAAQGLDLKRPIYMALYPMSEAEERELLKLEGQLREELKIPGEDDLQEVLRRYSAKPPEGLYAKLVQYNDKLKAQLGLRVIVPMEDEAVLLGRLDALFEQGKFRVALSDSGRPLRRVFFKPDVGDMIVAVSVQGKDAILDVFPELTPQVKPGALVVDEVKATVLAKLNQVKAGGPFAPMPLGRTAFSLSMDQRGVSMWLRYVAYTNALTKASTASSQRRDAALMEQLKAASKHVLGWDVGAAGISGVSYDLLLSEGTRLVGLRTSLFGARALTLPEAAKPKVTLGLAQRALGFGLDGALLFGPAWQSWLGVNKATVLKQAFDLGDDDEEEDEVEGSSEGGLRALSVLLSGVRNLVLLPVNLSAIVKTSVPIELSPLYTQRERYARVEVATHGLNLSGFLAKPQLAVLITFAAGLTDEQQDAAASALLHAVHDFDAKEAKEANESQEIEDDVKPADAPPAAPLKLAADQLTTLRLASPDAQFKELRYLYKRRSADGAAGWMMVGLGLEDDALNAEIAALSTPSAEPEGLRPLYLRVEPVGLVQLLSTYKPAQLAALDLNVLAQRLGPLLLSYEGVKEEGVGVVHATIELRRPPSLD